MPATTLLSAHFGAHTLIMALALCTGSAAMAQSASAPAPAAAASAPADPNLLRPEVVTPLIAAQDLARAGSGKEALLRVDAAAAIPNLSDLEKFEILRTRARALAATDDIAAALKLYDEVLAHPRTDAQERAPLLNGMLGTAYNAKMYGLAVRYGERLQREGGGPATLLFTLASARYLDNDYAGAAKDMESFIAAETAAKRVPTEQQLRLLGSSHGLAKNDAGYISALQLLVEFYPKKEVWADLIARSLRNAGLSERMSVQVQRLRRAAGTLEDGEDYLDHAEVSSRAGFPAEALRVLDEGQAKGQFTGAVAGKVQQLRTRVTKQLSDDEKSLGQAASQGATARDGNLLVNTGFAYVTTGQVDRGLAMMQEGMGKGSLRRPGEAMLNLGIAQLWAGQRDAALKSFAAVQGSEGEPALARLWALLKTAQR